MVPIYIISMAIAFSFYFGGAQVFFWYKYLIAFLWAISYLGVCVFKNRKIKGNSATIIKIYVYPLLMIMAWSLFIFIFHAPSGANTGNITRMVSNILYLILAITSAISTTYFFGKKVIKYSVWAILISILANLIYCIHLYGMGVLLQYLPQAALSTDFPFGSVLYNFASCIEVQDATLATGFYILYFVLFDEEDNFRTKMMYIIILLICSYLGFKRTEFIAVLFTGIVMWLIKESQIDISLMIKVIGIILLIFSFGYICIVKWDVFQIIVDKIGADVTGRQNVYRNLAKYYEISPIYIGKGFTFVDKTMYDTTGFAAHNTIVRMYAELGFIPFIIWIIWYIMNIPLKILNKFGRKNTLIVMTSTLYLFLTYCIGNSMNFYCIQYSFILITVATMNNNEKSRYRKVKFKI